MSRFPLDEPGPRAPGATPGAALPLWADCPCPACREALAWPADRGADVATLAGLAWLAVLLIVLLLTPW